MLSKDLHIDVCLPLYSGRVRIGEILGHHSQGLLGVRSGGNNGTNVYLVLFSFKELNE